MGAEGDVVAQRLARGSRCFVVWIDQAIAGYGWLSTGPEWVGELQLEIRPGPGEGYVWNCVTMARHRRKGVFHSLLLGIVDLARREGFRRLWIGSVAIPAERAVGESGFHPAVHFASMTAAGLQMVSASPASDGGLAADGARVLGIRTGLSVRRSRRVRH